MIRIFLENEETIRKAGWVISDPMSFEWWDGFDSADKIVISAFLVQLTKWETVKNVILSMERKGLSSLEEIAKLDISSVEKMIKPVNFYRTKARRILNFARFAKDMGGLSNVLKLEKREVLLSQDGVGEETADSILLFAGHQLVFPNTDYSRRVITRVSGRELKRREVASFVKQNFNEDLYVYKVLHAGLGAVGKTFCLLTKPKCDRCFLKQVCEYNYRYS